MNKEIYKMARKSNVFRLRKIIYSVLLAAVILFSVTSGVIYGKYEWLSSLLLSISSGCISGLIIAIIFNFTKGRLEQEMAEVDYLDNRLNVYDGAILLAHRKMREALEADDWKEFHGYLKYYIEKYQKLSSDLNIFVTDNPHQRLFQQKALKTFDDELIQLQELYVSLDRKLELSQEYTLHEIGKLINLLFSSYDAYNNFGIIHNQKRGEMYYISDVLKKSSF